eukprot:4723743-Lingulodinium_polyedra.AAC.1
MGHGSAARPLIWLNLSTPTPRRRYESALVVVGLRTAGICEAVLQGPRRRWFRVERGPAVVCRPFPP